MAPFIIFIIFISLFTPIIHIQAEATARRSRRDYCIKLSPSSSSSLFIFGDSLFDSGNNNYINTSTLDKANFWPYGETYFRYPTGRFSNGRLISDFIAERVKVPLIPPYLQPRRLKKKININNSYHGVNFASAGAGVLSSTFQGMVIDLGTQIEYYKREMSELSEKIGKVEAARISSRALYLFSIGTNDYMSPFLLNSTLLESYSHTQYVEMVTSNLSAMVKAIFKSGGRKFVFLNLGELGCLPGLRVLAQEKAGGCLKEASQLAKLHNKSLNNTLSIMARQLQGFKYFLFDFNSSLVERFAQPSKHGFKEAEKACCGTGRFNGVFSCGGKRPVKEFELCENPNDFVFWDSYHLTEKANKQIARQMWSVGDNSFKRSFQCTDHES